MNTEPTVFAQIIAFLPLHEFRKCVQRYRGDYKVRKFSCLDQFFCLAFAQLTYWKSLRDIVSCLKTVKSRVYHMGISGRVSRNNLANANEARDWRIYADFAQVLIAEARRLYRDEDIGLELEDTGGTLLLSHKWYTFRWPLTMREPAHHDTSPARRKPHDTRARLAGR